jgi:hypothetical protein
MTGLRRKTDFYQMFEKGYRSSSETINISFLLSIPKKKSRISGRKRAEKSHVRSATDQYD